MDQGAPQTPAFEDSDIPSRAQAKTVLELPIQQQDTNAALDQGAAAGPATDACRSADSTPTSEAGGGALTGIALAGLTSSAAAAAQQDAALDKDGPTCGQVVSSSSSSSVASQDGASEDSSSGPCLGNERNPQICFDFTKGLCTRGDKCKYSHDIATIVQFNSKEKGICFDYLRNQCHRGLLCRFSHDLSNIAQQCQTFNSANSNGAMATKNRSGSICYDFVKGVCTRGAECRYSHDLTLIAHMARTSNGGAADADQGQQTDVCFDFLRGRCSRGDACKYSHNASLLGGFPGFAPGLLPGSFGNPGMGMMDPSLGAPWPLGGINPQTAAAAAAAAAAAYAAAGPGAANLGNVVNRLGMLGLGGADPTAAAAAAALAGMPAATAGLGPMGPGRPPFDPSGFNNKMLTDALQGDALAMFMAMQQGNPLLPGGGPHFPGGPRPGMHHMPLPPKMPHPSMGRQPGQPTPEQMMLANAEISRMLEKSQQAASQAQTTNPLLMQQQMLSEALTSGMPAPHLASTPKNAGMPTSAPFACGADVNVSELLAAAAAAANSAPMSSAASDLAALQAGMRPGALGGHMMGPAASAGLAHMPPPGALGGMHPRMGNHGGQAPFHAQAGAHKHHQMGPHGGMLPGHGGISAGRGQAGNAQAAAAAAAIAAVAAQGAPGGPHQGGPLGPATDSQGNILPLSRLQEIWSR